MPELREARNTTSSGIIGPALSSNDKMRGAVFLGVSCAYIHGHCLGFN